MTLLVRPRSDSKDDPFAAAARLADWAAMYKEAARRPVLLCQESEIQKLEFAKIEMDGITFVDCDFSQV